MKFKLAALSIFVITLCCVYPCTSSRAQGSSNSKEFDSLLHKAEALVKKQKSQAAMVLLKRAIKLKPTNSTAHANMSYCLWANGKVSAALQEAQKAVKLNPNDPLARHFLGVIYLSMGNNQDAVNNFRAEYKIDPKRNCHCGTINGLLLTNPSQR